MAKISKIYSTLWTKTWQIGIWNFWMRKWIKNQKYLKARINEQKKEASLEMTLKEIMAYKRILL